MRAKIVPRLWAFNTITGTWFRPPLPFVVCGTHLELLLKALEGPALSLARAYSQNHWTICRPCWQHRHTPGIAPGELAEAVGFIIYALEHADRSGDHSLRDMYQYKNLSPGQIAGRGISEPGQRIRTLLYVTLRDSLPLLSRTVGPVEIITEVPSTSTKPGRDRRALPDAIDSAVSQLPGIATHHPLLVPRRDNAGASRALDPDRFGVIAPDRVVGRHVLLVEDTWVSGASVQSAAVALRRAGARRVTALCVWRV